MPFGLQTELTELQKVEVICRKDPKQKAEIFTSLSQPKKFSSVIKNADNLCQFVSLFSEYTDDIIQIFRANPEELERILRPAIWWLDLNDQRFKKSFFVRLLKPDTFLFCLGLLDVIFEERIVEECQLQSVISEYFVELDRDQKNLPENSLAKKLYEQFILQGDPSAQYHLGLYCYKVCEYSDEYFMPWIRSAALQRCSSAISFVLKLADKGINSAVRVRGELCTRADNGDSNLAYLLGQKYEYGKVVRKNIKLAIDFYFQSAKKGNKEALGCLQRVADSGIAGAKNNLGYLYGCGQGVPKDLKRAFVLYKYAADADSSAAQYNVALDYENGWGTEPNLPKAKEYYVKAARQGNNAAIDKLISFIAQNGDSDIAYILGQMYENGGGVDKDLVNAAYGYFESAEKGNKEALGCLQRLADSGIAEAKCDLWRLYGTGIGVPQDQKQAFVLFKSAADAGYEVAQYNVALYYENGWGTEPDLVKAKEYYVKAARQGNNDAINRLISFVQNGDSDIAYIFGQMYENGQVVSKDLVIAACWYHKSAEKGNKEALGCLQRLADSGDAGAKNYLGYLYVTGIGVPQDQKQAFVLFKSAADADLSAAQNNVAGYYENGWGTEPDLLKAKEYYIKAARQENNDAINRLISFAQNGDSDIAYILGQMYENGKGVSKDLVNAAYWYYKSAEKGNKEALGYLQRLADSGIAEAKNYLGRLYGAGTGVPQDQKQAFVLFKSAADAGYEVAQYNVALYYENGWGTEPDLVKAKEYYIKAAKKGFSDAIDRLKEFAKERDKEALDSLQKLADSGNASAQYCLGCVYDNGEGVPKDLEKAFVLFKSAADAGLSKAQHNVAIAFEYGKGVIKDLTKAKEYYIQDAKSGCSVAIDRLKKFAKEGEGDSDIAYILGQIYENGQVVSKDIKLAVDFYFISAKEGNKEALDCLYKLEQENNAQAILSLGDLIEVIYPLMRYYPELKKEYQREGLKYYRRAAVLGNPTAMYRLAECSRDGFGDEKVDYGKYVEHLKTAFAHGYSLSMCPTSQLQKDFSIFSQLVVAKSPLGKQFMQLLLQDPMSFAYTLPTLVRVIAAAEAYPELSDEVVDLLYKNPEILMDLTQESFEEFISEEELHCKTSDLVRKILVMIITHDKVDDMFRRIFPDTWTMHAVAAKFPEFATIFQSDNVEQAIERAKRIRWLPDTLQFFSHASSTYIPKEIIDITAKYVPCAYESAEQLQRFGLFKFNSELDTRPNPSSLFFGELRV